MWVGEVEVTLKLWLPRCKSPGGGRGVARQAARQAARRPAVEGEGEATWMAKGDISCHRTCRLADIPQSFIC